MLDKSKKKGKSKSSVTSAYDNFLENKKELLDNSSLLSAGAKNILNKGKLKTIAEQKATLTIDRE